MKTNIAYDFVDGPWGGANQFLLALKNEMVKKGVYTALEDANIIIINSHTEALRCLKQKLKNPKVTIIHRVDGPMRLIRGFGKHDFLVHKACHLLADGVVFQSQWSKDENIKMGLKLPAMSKIIFNAPNNTIFYPAKKHKLREKTRIIASSWSGNMRKGFDVFQWLDDNLDFTRYEMLFVGNSPIEFKNIRHIKSQKSKTLANILRCSDIYICASKAEGCSNALLEALHCGLPTLALNASSNPEVLGSNGFLFNTPKEIPDLLNKIVQNYGYLKNNIKVADIHEIAAQYLGFINEVYEVNRQNKKNKKIKLLALFSLLYEIFLDKYGYNKFEKLKRLFTR